MKITSHSLQPLVSPEELQGLLGSVPVRQQRSIRWSTGVWMVVLTLVKASLLVSMSGWPLANEVFASSLSTYIGLRSGLELALMGVLALSFLSARYRRWCPMLTTVAITTCVLDLLAWGLLGT